MFFNLYFVHHKPRLEAFGAMPRGYAPDGAGFYLDEAYLTLRRRHPKFDKLRVALFLLKMLHMRLGSGVRWKQAFKMLVKAVTFLMKKWKQRPKRYANS